MWELFLVVFVSQKHARYLTDIKTNYKATGAMGGYLGNKGGLLLQFSLYDKKFMFLNCHLASGAFNSAKRSDMMAKILKDIGFSGVYPDALADFCTLMGDMNYRFKTTYAQHIDSVQESQ